MNRSAAPPFRSLLLLLVVGAVTAALAPPALSGQARATNTKMPSTLRYGSGLIDVPVASVLPHLAVTGTYSGFSADIPGRPIVDARGIETGQSGPFSKWYQDASVALGLFDRIEVGSSFQSFADADDGGNMVGAFGRVLLLRPDRFGGLGLAAGARYVSSPSFDDIDPGAEFEPGRLGFPDSRLRGSYDGPTDGVDTNFSPYVVGSAVLPGFDARFLPDHDLTFALGWGDGMFRDGGDLQWYAPTRSKGWFFGTAIHVGLADDALLNIVGDYNGYDVNLGGQLDWNGVRVGAYALGLNYLNDRSAYRTTKFGVAASLAVCPGQGGLCEPSLMEREPEGPDTVRIPPPPPDTVVVEREVEVAPPLPTGEPASMCLATGQDVEVLITAQRDTLVGPDRVDISELRPGVVFAGTYAEDRPWFTGDEAITFGERDYQKSGGEVRLRCADIMRVGEYEGVPLFTDRTAEEPYETLYVPVRPGVWQAYEAGLRRTRG